ncbi:multicopper oxidase [Clostridium sp.]|uniref:multicopper oxidase family protein n=1 Tax=Clostridium sp. TaxID=1506 RepID=UPI0029156C04|nr:multicopper oxidase [Clostridium sp.]MDU3525280.1 multicopper oxidase [Clostridium sp.]MDU3546628.1 multicopper oxidase [Clostridium sp.]MDU6364291.1 multicopper oxidase [Clostridium sp.]
MVSSEPNEKTSKNELEENAEDKVEVKCCNDNICFIVNPSDPFTIPKFIDKLLIPGTAQPINDVNNEYKDNEKYYHITMKEAEHYFSSYFPPTKIWGYNGLYPGPTIEAFKNISTNVLWDNKLPDKHFLPYDTTLHGTVDDPEGKTVVHLHGAKVESSSDGHPEAWFTNGFKITGPEFTRKVYEYTNYQSGATLWYHDHAMGQTRLNVYAGLAGFYILRDLLEERLNLPKGKYEVPLLVQDKSFTEEGELFYPAAPPFPVSVFPSIVPGFFGDTIVVNGKVWPYLDVEPRKYRFRILNASNRRQYIMRLSNNEEFIQIGTDGGLIEEPVNLTSFKLMPAERIDIIIDFSQHVGERIILMNDDTNADISGTNMIMRFNVVKPLQGEDTSVVPSTLRVVHPLNKGLVRRKRKVSFGAMTDRYGRPMLMIDNMTWSDPITEKPELDSIEIWNLINPMPLPHPIHIHLIQFKILWRRPFDVEAYNNTGEVIYTGPKEEPHDYERGFKDTVDSEAGKVTRIIMQFKGYAGNYVWHCHFLEHEDYEMMRPLKVVECNCVK